MTTEQIKTWTGDFGANYTERCTFGSDDAFNALYEKRYGMSRDAINSDWVGNLSRDVRILEVGCNIGNQLRALQRLGFENLYGIDVQRFAVERAKGDCQDIDIIVGSAFDIPFKDGFFDLVFTNNVLIHIAPDMVGNVMDEMIRVTRKHVWGFEYYAPEFTTINYRGNEDLLWKADYPRLFLDRQPGALEVARTQIFDCLDEPGNKDIGYLLSKTAAEGVA